VKQAVTHLQRGLLGRLVLPLSVVDQGVPCYKELVLRKLTVLAWLVASLSVTACNDEELLQNETPDWRVIHEELGGALLSVWGRSASDVWAVGGDNGDGTGPLVLHYDGSQWQRLQTGQTAGALWWVFGFEDGPLYMGGSGGVILRYESDQFTLLQTPSQDTVFGIWGASPNDVWAVGGASESGGGFAWRLQDDTWQLEPSVPDEVTTNAAIWKIYGTSHDDAWLVGSNGVSLHWDGDSLSAGDTGVGSSLFTVHAAADRYVAVGGLASGIIVEHGEEWTDVTPDPLPVGLSGVCLTDDGGGIAVGSLGAVYRRGGQGWHEEDTGLSLDANLHSVWIDAQGGAWAVGGQTYVEPFTDGVLIHNGAQHPPRGL
jgi:hypothetical protein